ncbi:interferon lambda receptor 1 [Rhinoderma darwinii]|uniref:interferon lambda receptor 1 n=1 Tax=Rhinoderma darwinii TaxID=43563 RepID=UPI003F66F6BA
MSSWLEWTLLFVNCLVGHAAGKLHEPLNVTVESRNFSLFLKWLPAAENPSSVTYEVQYTSYTADHDSTDKYRWAQVPTCKNISRTECNFTCVLMDSWDWNHSVQVRAVSPSISSWVQIQNIEYLFTVDPDPPILNITQGNGSITIDVFTPWPFCARPTNLQLSLKYFVVISRKNNPKEIILEQELDEPTITMKTLGYIGEYCIAARTIYSFVELKNSKFSNPICLNFTQKDGLYRTVLLAALLIVPSVICVAVMISVIIWYQIPIKSMKPKALDFSHKYCLRDGCLPAPYSDIYHSPTIYNIAEEQDSSTKFMLPNKYEDRVNNYPISGQGYMERPTMQTSDSLNQEYFSSHGLTFNSSSDKSSSDRTCPNTSGSVTDMLLNAMKDQSNQCTKESNINVSEDVQMFSLTSMPTSNLFDSLSIPDPNSLVNVPFDTLCIVDDNAHMDNSDEESGNKSFTDSEDCLKSLSTEFTDYKISDSKVASRDEKTQKDLSSDYKQRTYMIRR